MNTPTQTATIFYLFTQHERGLLCHQPEDEYSDDVLIPLTSDIVFKGVFGSPGSEAILAALLSAVRQDYGFPAVSEVEISNPFNLQTYQKDKLSVVDARVRDRGNTLFNIEVQSYRQSALRPRILYYWARSYSDGVNGGEPYTVLKPVVGVAFVDFHILGDNIPAHSCFELRERTLRHFVYNEHLAIHVLELPKFDSIIDNDAAQASGRPQIPSTPLQRWVYFMRRAGAEDEVMKKIKAQEPMITQAEERYHRFLDDADARAASLEHERWVRDRAQMIWDGEQRGLAKGRAETAAKMLELGADEEFIMKATDLSREQLRELKERSE